MRGRLTLTLFAASAAVWVVPPAHAAVEQLDGTTLPQPSPAVEVSVVTSRGFAASADTLAGLFQSFAGGVDRGLDPIADAATTPGTFDPTCGLRVSVVLRAGDCQSALGWYNATQSAAPPATNQIYPVVPANLTGAFPNGIGCLDTDFCPLASRDTDPAQGSQHTWADPLPAFDPQIAASPNWKGGPVGFALLATSARCTQTKFSQADLNPPSVTYNGAWITALVYPSAAAPGAVYLAFEDSPMSPTDWKQYGADGDFNDDVFFVAPTPCASGGAGAGGVAGSAAVGGRGAAAGGASGAASGGAGGASGAAGGARGAAGGTNGAAGGTSGAAGGSSGAPGGRGGAGGGVAGTGGASGTDGGGTSGGTAGGSAGQSSAAGGQTSAGGSPGATGGAAGPTFDNNSGGCGCQSADGSAAGLLGGLVFAALAGLRRRGRRPKITRP